MHLNQIEINCVSTLEQDLGTADALSIKGSCIEEYGRNKLSRK